MCAVIGTLLCGAFYVISKVFGIDLYMPQEEAQGLMKPSFLRSTQTPLRSSTKWLLSQNSLKILSKK